MHAPWNNPIYFINNGCVEQQTKLFLNKYREMGAPLNFGTSDRARGPWQCLLVLQAIILRIHKSPPDFKVPSAAANLPTSAYIRQVFIMVK